MIDTVKVLQITEQYDVITFDVFDTLIIRDVIKPTDVFELVGGKIFRYRRILAEMLARKLSKKEDITLNDIYKFLPKKYLATEIECEETVCRANPEVFSIYKVVKNLGKKIYAVSDMYLPKDVISEILNNCGYEVDDVVVSSGIGLTKSTGNLFRYFLEQNDFFAESVLHIGDNMISDYKGARKVGINSFLIQKHTNSLSYSKSNKSNHELVSFINHGLYSIEDPVEKIGYEVVGPMVLSFCQWVHKQYQQDKFDKLFFLARDMSFVYGIYRSIYEDDDAHYLRVSRKSLRYARNNPEDFCKYLKNEGCYGNVALIDVGWVGVAQLEIERYSKMIDQSTDLGGLYLGSKFVYRLKKRSKKSHVCLYRSFNEQIKCGIYPPFIETLIGTNEKQVIAYKNEAPIFDQDTNHDCSANLIKNGAKKFISSWISIKSNKYIDPKITKHPFKKLFYSPKKEHIALMENLHYEDIKNTKINSYKEGFPYRKHPSQFITDLNYSAWKGAFFKKTGILYPFFLAMYYIVGNAKVLLADLKRYRKNDI